VRAREKSPFALDNSLAVYGIRKNPFPIGEADDFFFSTPSLEAHIRALRNLVEYGDLLLVISGVEGAGKTHASMTVDSLVDALLTGFGVHARGDDTMADEALLRSHLAQAHNDGDIAVLAVDDAHLLPRTCTDFLLGLAQQHDDIELRVMFATEPGRLGFSTSDPKHVHVVVLKPFDVQQCGDYLHTRLSHAGLVGDSPFDASVVDEIHQDSGGIPGEIHPLAVHALLANADTPRLRHRTPMTRRALAYLALVLVVAGAVAFWLQPEPGLDGFVVRDPGVTGRVKGRPLAGTEPGDIVPQRPVGTSAVQARSPEPEADPGMVFAKQPAKEKPTEVTKPVAAKTDDDVKVFTLEGERASTTAAVAVTSPAPVKSEVAVPGGEPLVSLAKNVTPAATAAGTPRIGRDLDWLRRQDPSHYVIQLVGTRDASAARKFVDSHQLGEEGAWFVTAHQDKPWYVVVYGMYPDKASARAAIETLPEALRAGSPWPRTVASVVDNAR
jgi:DamX protein